MLHTLVRFANTSYIFTYLFFETQCLHFAQAGLNYPPTSVYQVVGIIGVHYHIFKFQSFLWIATWLSPCDFLTYIFLMNNDIVLSGLPKVFCKMFIQVFCPFIFFAGIWCPFFLVGYVLVNSSFS